MRPFSIALVVALVLAVLYAGYELRWKYQFETIADGAVYKSAAIDPDELERWVKAYGIRTVIDLRKPGTQDRVLNPEVGEDVAQERAAVARMTGVNYVNVPSAQVPDRAALEGFFKVMDNPDNYPVLIHCHHGTGRAVLFSALYRIEYLGLSPEEARRRTRVIPVFSPFGDGTEKGEFLRRYVPRRSQASATLPHAPLLP